MKVRLLTLVALLFGGAAAHAQEMEYEEPFRPFFALEIGTGMAPIHTLVNSVNLNWDRDLADQGLDPQTDGMWCPAFSLSAAWHTHLKWEFVLTGGFSWINYKVIQHDTFGWDPQGKPRYNLTQPLRTYRMNSHYAGALFFQARRFWNPTQKVKLYSAVGAGLYMEGKEVHPVPSLTLIAVRFGTGNLKFFIENTFSPAVTGFLYGMGWAF